MAAGLVRVGCCGWPVARPRYLATFDLVEVQQSFYRLPRPATVEGWRAEAPPDFEFVLKAPQLITHEPTSPTYRRLGASLDPARRERYGSFKPTAEVREAWRQTLALARALRSRIMLFQCPASFTPTAAHVRDLVRFFEEAERDGLAFAWEPRGPWPDAEVEALCRRLGLVHCVDPFERRPVWGEPAYFRLHGPGSRHARYSDDALARLAAMVTGRGRAYVLFNNAPMFEDAQRFRRLIGAG